MKAMHDGHAGVVATPVDEASGDTRKLARRREKAEARIRLRATLPLDPWERFRILSDLIKVARQVVDLSDHRARYGLIIVGALNAGLLAVIGRDHVLASIPDSVRPWLVGVLVIYGLLTLAFVLYAIESLRPRRLEAASPEVSALAGPQSPGLLFWDAVDRQELDRFHEAWDQVRLGQINREAETMLHALSNVVLAKHRALHWLYRALAALVLLATLLLAAVTWLTIQS